MIKTNYDVIKNDAQQQNRKRDQEGLTLKSEVPPAVPPAAGMEATAPAAVFAAAAAAGIWMKM